MNIESLYKELEQERKPYLERAKTLSMMTIKDLFYNDKDFTQMKSEGYSSISAGVIEKYCRRLVIENFPLIDPFFDINVDEKGQVALKEINIKSVDVDSYLRKLRNIAVDIFDERSYRTKIEKIYQHLNVIGSLVTEKDEETGDIILHTLENFVLKYGRGEVLKLMIVREYIHKDDIEEEYGMEFLKSIEGSLDKDDYAPLYTKYERKGKNYIVTQAISDKPIGEESKVAEKRMTVTALNWDRIDGENYGRGSCEKKYDAIRDVNIAAYLLDRTKNEMLDYRYVVKSNDPTFATRLNDGKPGDYVHGDGTVESTVNYQQAQVIDILRIDLNEKKDLLKELFGEYNSDKFKNRDRVTAKEIGNDETEREVSMANAGNFANQFTKPFIRDLLLEAMDEINVSTEIRKIYNQFGKLKVFTGVSVIRKNQELQKLQQWGEMMVMTAQMPEHIQQSLDVPSYAKMIDNAINMDSSKFIISEEQKNERAGNAKNIETQSQIEIENAKAEAQAQNMPQQ